MPAYRAEHTAELLFNFPDGLNWSELDRQGVKLPVRMKFVDLVIEREKDILLVEIKGPVSLSKQRQRPQRLPEAVDGQLGFDPRTDAQGTRLVPLPPLDGARQQALQVHRAPGTGCF